MTDLIELDEDLQDLYQECVRLGVPKSISDRLIAVSSAIPIIERARERQEKK